MAETNPPQLYSVAECAKFLSVSIKTMWRLIYARKITTVRINRRVLISDEAIREFVDAAKQESVDAKTRVNRILRDSA